MICPSCGTENSVESRFCAKCAIDLRLSVATVETSGVAIASPTSFDAWVSELADENLIDQIPTETAPDFHDTLSESDLWPAESVFVPTAEDLDGETAAITEREVTALAFEDEEADDFFEQSLSGLKLADADSVETVNEPAAEPELVPEPVVVPEPLVIPEPVIVPEPIVPEPVVVPEPIVVPDPVVDPEPEGSAQFKTVEPSVPVRKRRWGRLILRVAGAFLFAAVMFMAGLATGIWLLGIPASQVPEPTAVEVVAEAPVPKNVPPPGMAFVPGGEFQMGSDEGDPLSRPAHPVTVAPFFIDVTEVTNAAYLEFVNATGHSPPPKWKDGTFPEGEARFPVTGVNWYDALEFAAWAGKRLPTEAEWEFAAGGNQDWMYPWGNEWNESLANANEIAKGVRNVGEGGRSPFGLFDMSGNAWEWTSSDAKNYPDGKEFPWSRLRLKIIRGGNWQSGPKVATNVFRGYYGAAEERAYDGAGFRCVKDVPKG